MIWLQILRQSSSAKETALSVSLEALAWSVRNASEWNSVPEELKLLTTYKTFTKKIENVAHQHLQLPSLKDKPVVMF